MESYDETQDSINMWATKTFGVRKYRETAAARMNIEVAELIDHLCKRDLIKAQQECADIYIVLCCVASDLHIDLHDEVNKKMAINHQRKWKLHGDGTAQHIEE